MVLIRVATRAVLGRNHGRVIGRDGDVVEIEVPADISIGLAAIWGQAGFATQFMGCEASLAERRVFDHDGRTIVCHGDMVMTTFNRYRIYLDGKSPEAGLPDAGEYPEVRQSDFVNLELSHAIGARCRMTDSPPERPGMQLKDLIVAAPLLASALAMAYEVGCFWTLGLSAFYFFRSPNMSCLRYRLFLRRFLQRFGI